MTGTAALQPFVTRSGSKLRTLSDDEVGANRASENRFFLRE